MGRRGFFGAIAGLFSKHKYPNAYYELAELKVKDVMSGDVLCAQKNDRLINAAHTMIAAEISCLLVLDNYKPAGIISERDFIKKLNMSKKHSEDMLVGDLMSSKLFSVSSNTTLFDAFSQMRERGFRKLVIMNDGELKGMLTQTDLCKALARLKTHPDAPILAKDVMKTDVWTMLPTDSFLKAQKFMASKDVGSILIAEKDELKGIFTESDLVSEFFMNPNKLWNSYLKDLMSSPLICVPSDFDLMEINKVMLKHKIRRIPIVDKDKTVGVLTQTDIARLLFDHIQKNKDREQDKSIKQKEYNYTLRSSGAMRIYEKTAK